MIDASFVRPFFVFEPNQEEVTYYPRSDEGTFGTPVAVKTARKLPLTKEDLNAGSWVVVPKRSCRWKVWDRGEGLVGNITQGSVIQRANGLRYRIIIIEDGYFGAAQTMGCEQEVPG